MAEKKKPKTHQEKVNKSPDKTTAQIIKKISQAEGIINAIGDGLTIVDRTFKILYENQVHKDMMGDHVGEYCYEAYQNKERICGGCPFASTFKDGKVHTVQREMETDEGTRYVEITASPLKDSKGKIVAGIEVVREITEQKKIEKLIITERDKARLYLDLAGVVFVAINKEGNVTLINKKGCDVLGYNENEIIGKNWFENFLPARIKDEIIPVSKMLLRGKIEPAEYWENPILTKTGEERIIAWHNTILKDEKGNIIGHLSSGEDITERKRLEQQIVHAQRMESVGQLAGGIANDFNNILTAIIGFGHLLKTEMTENNPLTTYVTRILNAAKRAAILTRSLLAFSRTQIINLRPVNLNEIVRAMEYSLDRLIGDRIKLSIVLTDKDLTISADTHQMEQVLINLVTNAMDAMQDGGSLIIRTERFDLDDKFIKIHGYGKPGPYAILSIEDSGQGMDEETKARIFDPFFSTKGLREGAGLGLSMVYGTIRQHEGYINVYSELGKGTTFKIYLPLCKPTAEAIKESASHNINGCTETVLVAENDAEARETIKEVLKGSGYTVVEAENGEKAIRVFHENREGIKLLILDVIMPKKNGKDVFDEIRKVRPDMKAIFTSAYDINVIYKKGFLEEGLDFVSKPILPDKLLRKVRAVLGS